MTTATALTTLSGSFTPPTGVAPVPPQSPGLTNTGICSLSWGGNVFRFRTNPNEIWWSYELLTAPMDTYGGRVIQLLGTKLGDLRVKVDCGGGGWDYLMDVVYWMRDLLTDQRNGNTATFTYSTRNWMLNVYGMSIPFEDQVEATVRELELSFKIQEDVTGILSQATLDANILAIQDGTYGVGQSPHNQYNDTATTGVAQGVSALVGPGGPSYSPTNIHNTVDTQVQGATPGGLPTQLPFSPAIPGVSSLLGAL